MYCYQHICLLITITNKYYIMYQYAVNNKVSNGVDKL